MIDKYVDSSKKIIDVWSAAIDGYIDIPPVDGWCFFYDESHNYRKFKLNSDKPAGFNIEDALTYDFILGGIAFEPSRKPNADRLLDMLGIAQKNNELKANSVMKGKSFIEIIGQSRVHAFLEWMLESGVTVHFSALNNLYWSICDLIDEAVQTEHGAIAARFHKEMKDQLFFFAMNHTTEFANLLQRYGFPAI